MMRTCLLQIPNTQLESTRSNLQLHHQSQNEDGETYFQSHETPIFPFVFEL